MDPEEIPFAQANIKLESFTWSSKTIEFSEGKSVTVGVCPTRKGVRLLEFKTPDVDGKTSVLKFGLSRGATISLLKLLIDAERQEQQSMEQG